MTRDTIPLEALKSHVAILAKTGAGKSNAAKTVVEGLLDRGERVCAVDPTGTWWGLRLLPNGKPSPYKILIFGGQHADVAISGRDGAAIAEVVGTSATSCIIDTRMMKVSERTQFFTDFAETLLRANRGVLNLIIDEAHVFAPKGKVADPRSGMMLHAASNLVSLGRGIGLRIMLLSQRPAKLHNDVLGQVETLVAMRMMLPHDVGAIRDWIREQADVEKGREITASLPGLPTGDAWIWAPGLDLLERRRFPLVTTKDTGRPLTAVEAGVALERLEIADITAKLSEVAAEIVANDPAKMKAEIGRLTSALNKAIGQIKAPPAAPSPVTVTANQAEIDEARAQGEIAGIAIGITRAQQALAALRVDNPARGAALEQPRAVRAPVQPREAEAPVVASAGVTGPGQRILNALGWWKAFGFDAPINEQIAFIAGYSPTSTGYTNPRGALKTAGLINYPSPGAVSLTDEGAAKAASPDAPPSGEELRRRVIGKLSGPQQRILGAVIEGYPDTLANDEAATRAGYSATSTGYTNPRGSLKTLALINYPSPGMVRAADWLFPEGPR